MQSAPFSVSIVIPLYNEEASVDELHRRLADAARGTGHPCEVIFVNDGSRDGTRERLDAVQARDPAVRVVDLNWNAGQTAALAAGFAQASGDVIVAMDGDLQHEPEELPRFLAKIAEGYDIVSGWRQGRRESLLWRRAPSWVANRLMAIVSGVPLHDFGTTYKAYRRAVVERICLYGDFHRFIPALAKPLGASIAEVPIAAPPRSAGASNYSFARTATVFFDILRIRFLLSFLSRPLQFFGAVGFLLMLAGGVMGAVLIHDKYARGMSIMVDRGPFFIVTVFALMAGLQMLSIGFLGEILTRFYHEFRPAALYSVREIKGRGLAKPASPA